MRAGLRTEIILSISFLLAAALLFAGFLMVKLTERNMLEQRRAHALSIMQLVASSVDGPAQTVVSDDELLIAVASFDRLQTVLAGQADILAWRLLNRKLQVLSSTVYESNSDLLSVPEAAFWNEGVTEVLVYESFQLFGAGDSRSYLDLTMPLWSSGQPYGVLQLRFSLEGLQRRVQQAQQLILVYVIVYGFVLALFAVYLLNRNVVKPIRQLQEATTIVADGALTPVEVPQGPGEIHELAASFNRMVSALAESRAESEDHIASLEKTNRALEVARDELVRSEKLATVGHLAAGMAHEIGNPLGAVIGYLNILKEDLSGDSRDLVERSLVETSRIDRLVRELLEYSAPFNRQTESFCPTALLRETVDMLRHQGQFDDVKIVDQIPDEGCLVQMDRGRLMQVWINLLLNAKDAVGGSGEIELTAQRQQDVINFFIRDSGEGIDPEVAKRIFEPFFTTKAHGSGYGLGLAVCQRIIDESGGSIQVVADDGRGTCFSVNLPCTLTEIS